MKLNEKWFVIAKVINLRIRGSQLEIFNCWKYLFWGNYDEVFSVLATLWVVSRRRKQCYGRQQIIRGNYITVEMWITNFWTFSSEFMWLRVRKIAVLEWKGVFLVNLNVWKIFNYYSYSVPSCLFSIWTKLKMFHNLVIISYSYSNNRYVLIFCSYPLSKVLNKWWLR